MRSKPRATAWRRGSRGERLVHNPPAVLASLVTRWRPSKSWPLVIDAIGALVRAHSHTAEVPEQLADVAAVAISCGGAEQAAMLAREALNRMPGTPSVMRCKALRTLGTALLCQGQTVAGLSTLDGAVTIAAIAREPVEAAIALCCGGLHALNHGDSADAERRFRGVVALLSTSRQPNLLAMAHHNLAIALLLQGKNDDAEDHAARALALRPDEQSHWAEEDRMLLEKTQERLN